MPDLAGSNGVPASSASQVPLGRPHEAAMALKFPPTVSVADVSTTVCSPNNFSCSSPATDSGATDTESP